MKKMTRVSANTNMKTVKASQGTTMLTDVRDKLEDLVDAIENMDEVEYKTLKEILGDEVLDSYMDDLQDLRYNI